MYIRLIQIALVLSMAGALSWSGEKPLPGLVDSEYRCDNPSECSKFYKPNSDFLHSSKGLVSLSPYVEVEEGTRVTNAIPTILKKNFTGTVIRDFQDGTVQFAGMERCLNFLFGTKSIFLPLFLSWMV